MVIRQPSTDEDFLSSDILGDIQKRPFLRYVYTKALKACISRNRDALNDTISIMIDGSLSEQLLRKIAEVVPPEEMERYVHSVKDVRKINFQAASQFLRTIKKAKKLLREIED